MRWTANEWLIQQGHNPNNGVCEQCWQRAAIMYAWGQGGYESKVEAYYAAMDLAEKEAAREVERINAETPALEQETGSTPEDSPLQPNSGAA